MVFPLRLFIGLLLAFWSRVAQRKYRKQGEKRKARRQKNGAACAQGEARAQPRFLPQPKGRLEVTNALESLFKHGPACSNPPRRDSAETTFNRLGRTGIRFQGG